MKEKCFEEHHEVFLDEQNKPQAVKFRGVS
jgi:hypothetical protein